MLKDGRNMQHQRKKKKCSYSHECTDAQILFTDHWVNKTRKCLFLTCTCTHYSKFDGGEQCVREASAACRRIQEPFTEAYHHVQPVNTISVKAALLFQGGREEVVVVMVGGCELPLLSFVSD